MSDYGLEEFLAETRTAVSHSGEPADCVEAVAPLLHRLINAGLFQYPGCGRDRRGSGCAELYPKVGDEMR